MAQTTTDQAQGGFSFGSLLLPILLALFVFMMFRKQRKTQKTVQSTRTQMVPGTEVMTQFGLFGTILSIDSEENKAVLELSPGNTATVHLQALTKVVTSEPAADGDAPVVPDDASSITAEPQAETAPAADPVRRSESGACADESPEETLERLNLEKNKEN